ncbi:HD domain-containing protein [Heliorestis acidaminivorans]|uniref:HD domain-containing protein n=1 Tax=Heliorestis acidaminivorans TaxID=553427 RepID=A0A6I0EXR2_9FIRM|nr:HD domain-containing protein [Heliorestis acidaminivorans]KAB2953080.1 HD domain-containing protein [Heliorestis acidaminivorans]
MERIDRLLEHSLFIQCLQQNEMWERHRPFCHHDLAHLIDVARIAYAMALEQENYTEFSQSLGHLNQEKTKEVIYGAALLHDMGKWKQYEEGIDHAIIGAEICSDVLTECGFSTLEIDTIAEAIRCHRHKGKKISRTFLGRILALADYHSRLCFRCSAKGDCNWPERKQGKLVY